MRSIICCLLLLCLVAPSFGETTYQWPDAPPEVLREEIFGIRYNLMLEQKGAIETKKFLEAELRRHPTPSVKAYLARVYLLGPSLDEAWTIDHARGMQLVTQAAGEGSALAADLLGKMKTFGDEADRDEAGGLALIRQAAEKGQTRGMARYGFLIMLGRGGSADPALGEALINRAAALGEELGLLDAAGAYEQGFGNHPPDLIKARDYYYRLAKLGRRSAREKLQELADKGVPDAAMLRELSMVRGANEDTAMQEVRVRENCKQLEAYQSQDPRVWVELGVAHLTGRYTSRDYPLALNYLRRAQSAGQQEAAFFLALAKMEGWGVKREGEEGLREMQALADAGDARAANRLGVLYYWGADSLPDRKKDPAKAYKYTRLGAEGGYDIALLNLAFCYEHGIGVKTNSVLAAKVYWLAYIAGYSGAKEKVQRHLAFAKVP